jgi:hypothetical protein
MSTSQEFWGTPEKWPLDSADHVFLARTIDLFGSSLFGKEWTGKETTAERPASNVRLLSDDLYVNNLIATHVPSSGRKYFEPPPASRAFLPVIDASGAVVDLNQNQNLPDFNISPDEFHTAYLIAQRLNEENKPSIDRLERVQKEIARLALLEVIITAYRRLEGGDQVVIPRNWWNTEKLQGRFSSCQIEPSAPFNNQVSCSAWIYVSRASLKTLVSREPHLDTVKDKSEGKRGRRKGAGSFEKLDRPILEEMRTTLRSGEFASPEEAARKFADKAHGNGTIESKAERLARRYRSTFY